LLIESLEIDDHILDKIESKHGVTFEEVEGKQPVENSYSQGDDRKRKKIV
jgi:hypothetical protein